MTIKQIFALLAVIAVLVAGAWYLSGRGTMSEPRDQSIPVSNAEGRQAIETAVIEFGSRMKNVSLLAPSSTLAASLDSEYGEYVAPELISEWKVDPSNALGRQTSNPYPDSISVTDISRGTDGSVTVRGSVVEVTSDSPNEPAAVYPVTLRLEDRDGRWLIVSAEKGAYSDLPKRVTLVGRETCLSHRDTTGPQTLECAIGFRTEDGTDYALDLSLLSSTDAASLIHSGEEVRVEGVVTPAEALSSDRWQKYDMEGILSVTSVTRI